MDEKTLTALQGSIAKWEAIVNGTGYDEGCDNCPLCKEFANQYSQEPAWAQDGCSGCPVAQKAGNSSCGRTPYSAWVHYSYDNGEHLSGKPSFWRRYKVFDERSLELAKKELDFLRSLLPPLDRENNR